MKRNRPPLKTPTKPDYPFVTTYVVGSRYHITSPRNVRRLSEKLTEGLSVRIVREPENKFDKNACAVFIGRKQVGYIPRIHAKRIAKQLDRGVPYNFYVLSSELNGDSINIRLIGIRSDLAATVKPPVRRSGKPPTSRRQK